MVDAPDVVPRRVEVHVHLLDDHALLALDLLGVELRVAEHVDEDVERPAPVLGGALDVVPRVLLAGEGVELRADPVHLVADDLRRRPVLRALEEHVLGEVRDPARLGSLVAGSGREHDEAGDRLDLRHRRGQQPHPFGSTSRWKTAIRRPPPHSTSHATPPESPRLLLSRSRSRRARSCPPPRRGRRRASRTPGRSSWFPTSTA